MEQVLLSRNGKNILIKSQQYNNEEELQEIIKTNPGLTNLSIFESPIMIIGRETENMDVLAITADGVPVIIECKRKDNPDMRYLIAQVFEYASKLSEKSYNEFDQMVSKYLSSNRCESDQYKNLSLKEAFRKFKSTMTDVEEPYDDKEFVDGLSERLKNGEFYLIIVVDKISDVALRTIQFLNKKTEKLRIEIIEISKFSDGDHNIFVPMHINREAGQTTESRPGKITFEEMVNKSGIKEAEYLREFKNLWEDRQDFSITMGTKGFSARFKDIPVLYVLPDHIRIAPRIKRKYGHLYSELIGIVKKEFSHNTESSGNFDSPDFALNRLGKFVEGVKNFCPKLEE